MRLLAKAIFTLNVALSSTLEIVPKDKGSAMASIQLSNVVKKPLTGKVALVSGGAKGIGRATAIKLATEGCDVAINYYNSHEEALEVCELIRSYGRQAIAIQGDVGDPASVEEVLSSFSMTFSQLDFLISNAASGVLKPVMEMTRKHWRWCMEINALALVLLSQAALKMMSTNGRIIALSSLGASRAVPDYGFVGASKAALESLVRSLAHELGHSGIRVNAVSAGVVDTDALSYFRNRKQILEDFNQRNPTGLSMLPEHIADAVYLLCLPEAHMINGHTLVVDGGVSVSG